LSLKEFNEGTSNPNIDAEIITPELKPLISCIDFLWRSFDKKKTILAPKIEAINMAMNEIYEMYMISILPPHILEYEGLVKWLIF
jgi:hypothetical protein